MTAPGEPTIRVGIVLDRDQVHLQPRSPCRLLVDGRPVDEVPAGRDVRVVAGAEQVAVRPGPRDQRGARIRLEPLDPADDRGVLVRDVVVGRDFHWEHAEDLVFQGAIQVEARAARGGETHLDVIDEIGLERYLESVISSEMSAEAPPELLRAHAIVSRSWLLAQLAGRTTGGGAGTWAEPVEAEDGALELLRWQDREDHLHFDVCADDHCQRYQGATRASTPAVVEAVRATRGLVLTWEGEPCDTRFSKCCGGVTERFDAAWGEAEVPYLRPVADVDGEPAFAPPLDDEQRAAAFLEAEPDAWCRAADPELLRRLLPAIDHATRDFYRWEVFLDGEDIRGFVRDKLGIDIGTVRALRPLARGASGRITRLEMVGDRRVLRVGKELEIRRLLSVSHLYSSAFVVHPERHGFRLRGGGWGHGVGLCQVGAAVMADRGRDHRAILAHYYPGAALERRY